VLRSELHPRGLEVVTVSLELSGPEASRRYIEAAAPEHPSLLDREHTMDALFGVVNIPNVVWIDEQGVIVRPPEPGWPGPRQNPQAFTRRVRPAPSGESRPRAVDLSAILASGQDRDSYPGALRDWVEHGRASRYALTPEQVVARSQPRPLSMSEGAAHFELATTLWQRGERAAAIEHWKACHRLQPDNWTYKRQAWSLIGHERQGGDFGRFAQAPRPGEEASWPFESDFMTDVSKLGPGQYYPKTLD
jgi:hypothetical protein